MELPFPINILVLYLLLALLATEMGDPQLQLPAPLAFFRNSMLGVHQMTRETFMSTFMAPQPLKKTSLKTKQNFAMGSAGASVVSSSPHFFNRKSILDGQSDTYMFWECSRLTDNPFFVVFLSEDVYIEGFEFFFGESFSTYVKDFSVSTSLREQGNEWESLGFFKIEEGKKTQSFSLKSPHLGRYIKFEIHSVHKTPNFYCTLTQMKIFGRTYLDFTTQKSREKIDKEFKLISQKFEELEKEKEEMLEVYPLLSSNSPNGFEFAARRFKQLKVEDRSLKKPKISTMVGFLKEAIAATCHPEVQIFDSDGPLEPMFEVMNLKIRKVETENSNLKRMIANLTTIMIQKEVDKRQRIGADSYFVYNNERIYTKDAYETNFTYASYGEKLNEKARHRNIKRNKIRLLEERLKNLESILANSSNFSIEMRIIIGLLTCWAFYTLINLLLFLQKWLSKKREATLSQMASPFPEPARNQHLTKVFKSFVVERCLSNTKDDEKE